MIYLQLLLSYLKIGFSGSAAATPCSRSSRTKSWYSADGSHPNKSHRHYRHLTGHAGPYRHQQRHIRRICRDGYGLGCGPRYAGCLHPVAYPDACGHEVLSQAARQPLRVGRHGRNETDDDRNDNGRGAPAPHPETFIDWKSWAILAAAFLASFKKVNPILIIVLSAVAGLLLYL